MQKLFSKAIVCIVEYVRLQIVISQQQQRSAWKQHTEEQEIAKLYTKETEGFQAVTKTQVEKHLNTFGKSKILGAMLRKGFIKQLVEDSALSNVDLTVQRLIRLLKLLESDSVEDMLDDFEKIINAY